MKINKAIEPIENTLPDWEIICRLSTAMGYEMVYKNPDEVFQEIAALTPKSYGGMTYERLGISGLQWPCPSSDHPGTSSRNLPPADQLRRAMLPAPLSYEQG